VKRCLLASNLWTTMIIACKPTTFDINHCRSISP